MLIIGLTLGLIAERRIAGLKADVAAQTTLAEKAENKALALETAMAYREEQLTAVHGQAAQCEEARDREAREAYERRAILAGTEGRAGDAPRQAQGGIASPRISDSKETGHAQTRRAVADRLNRAL